MGKVKYLGCTDEQVKWGNCGDPRSELLIGDEYELIDEEVHSWHTKYILKGIPGKFNSVCFKKVGD